MKSSKDVFLGQFSPNFQTPNEKCLHLLCSYILFQLGLNSLRQFKVPRDVDCTIDEATAVSSAVALIFSYLS